MTAVGGLAAKHLIYLDRARTHEVHAEVQERAGETFFVTTEFPVGSADAREVVQAEMPLPSREAFDERLRDLETRLAVMGAYFRADADIMQWQAVAAAASAPKLDLRAHEFPLPERPEARIRFHHFHGLRDRLFVSIPHEDASDRFVLADLEFTFPHVADGEVRISHTRLHPRLLDARVTDEHIQLPRRGYEKMIEPAQYERAYGKRWLEAAKDTFRAATQLVLRPREVAPRPKAANHVARFAPTEIEQALVHPRVRAACARFITPIEESQVLLGGEFSIRRWVTAKRRRAAQGDQYVLSILEASLLARWAREAGRDVIYDDEGGKLVRYARGGV